MKKEQNKIFLNADADPKIGTMLQKEMGSGNQFSSFGLQGSLTAKIHEAIQNQNNLTYKTLGNDQYQILVDWYKQQLLPHQQTQAHEILKSDIVLSNSFLSIYCTILLGCTQQHDSILMFAPALNQYRSVVEKMGRRLSLWELQYCQKSNMFTIPSRQQLEMMLTHGERLVIICNPGNPLGNILREEQIIALLEICKQKQIGVMFDERLGDYHVEGKKFKTGLSYKYVHEDIVVINQVGHFLTHFAPDSALHGCNKVYSIFGSARMRGKVEKYLYQGFKILANYLHGVLIKISYQRQEGRQYWKYVNNLTLNNYKLVKAYFQHHNLGHLVGPYAGIFATVNLHEYIKQWKMGKQEGSSNDPVYCVNKKRGMSWKEMQINEMGFFVKTNYMIGQNSVFDHLFCVELRNSSNKILLGLTKLDKIIFPLVIRPKI